ncbi:histidine kinase [Streptomyces sp. N2-109]|uniref:histidine kinase n=1 Tax=Streptomyces gossypii TaxID=2883101 RepID=A0ABT2K356_9ACTN|nr:histidine kinase [Streptomyces gossypii]MCT2593965.1 histidine kinase [Streptomyces gossypii]
MRALLSPLTRAVTYTRWLHLILGGTAAVICGMVFPGLDYLWELQTLWALAVPVPLAFLAAMVPGMRLAEGLQARLMLLPGPHARHPGGGGAAISAAPSSSWQDRWRTAGWLVVRIEAGACVMTLSIVLPSLSLSLLNAALGGGRDLGSAVPVTGDHWWYAPLAVLPLAVLAALVVGAGAGLTTAARHLLGPSAAERLAELEERNERLLERGRLARELHDSIGHALTAAVVQSGAARASGSPEFTGRALVAIEETARDALEDLERVLRLLREGTPGPGSRPGLADTGRLLDSARAAGATVRPEVTADLAALPGPVSREGYRIVQEALTNVLRHAGPVAVSLRITARDGALELDIRNALPCPAAPSGVPGSGLRGIRERAALLGGEAESGPWGDRWRVYARLPLGVAAADARAAARAEAGG